jgi:membrane protein
MGALNRIFGLRESRSFLRRYALSAVLASVLAALILGALLLAVRGGGWVDLGPVQPLWSIARWLGVLVCLWAAIALLIRYAPNGYQPAGWVTLGGVLVIAAWVGMSLLWGWWAFSVANYKTPLGTAFAALTFVAYLYWSAIVFLVGAQLDELAMEQASPAGRRGRR